MTDADSNSACPCESGLPFSACCGVENKKAVNADIVAAVAENGVVSKRELTPQIQSAIASISGNPDLFPVRINFFDKKAWFVKMSPRWYRESVFLDPGRIKGTLVVEYDLARLEEVSKDIPWQPTSYIFHTAFCGSTLMSQALDALFNCLPLREPEVLGNALVYQRSQAATENKQVWLDGVLKLLSRRYAARQAVVVKTNDYANPLIMDVAKSEYQIPVLFMYTPLSDFLSGCLKANNRREWIAQRYSSVVKLVPQWLNIPADFSITEDAYGKMAAVYWSYNVALYLEAARDLSIRTRSLDFNSMLAKPAEAVAAAGKLFNLDPLNNVNVAEQIQQLFGVYSKNNKLTYSPEQRYNEINKLLKQHQGELDDAELLAQQLLGDRYPYNGLPQGLLDA
ncbi:MAG TPA: SEC-C domain-containing protein [Gammaproteobacteria bacterium]